MSKDFFRKGLFLLVLIAIEVSSCNEDSVTVPRTSSDVDEFIWAAMNQFYYWQSNVPELSDDKKSSRTVLDEFLNSYSSPEELFDDLLFEDDRFSSIVDDYELLEASFQGVSKSFGYDLRLLRITSDSDDLLAYIKYVVPGGPADVQGLKRGDLFTEVDGEKLKVDNFVSLLFDSDMYTITLSEMRDNAINSTLEEVSLVSVQLTENPILLSEVLEVDGLNVGYLVYNQFINNNSYHEELNDAFGEFVRSGITDLVLDLRYNGGGSLTTSRILASMLYSNADSNDVLGSIIYNEKLADFNTDISFLSQIPVFDSQGEQTSSINMNRLSLNRIFILTTGSTASASEFIIAGLLPFMDVTIIGTTSVGKNVGSVTLYDSEDFLRSETLNPNHKYAIQPIISQLANSEGFTDYIDGFTPNILIEEANFLGELKQLGDPSEALLSEALSIISGVARTERLPDNGMVGIDNDVANNKVSNTILVEGNYIPKNLRRILFNAQ
ncbi:S41 family peptidase [Ekhidna sp.]